MSYKVVKGDTLSSIAQKFGTTYQELARINGISNPNLIKVGQVLKLPNSSYSSSYNSYTELLQCGQVKFPSERNISPSVRPFSS